MACFITSSPFHCTLLCPLDRQSVSGACIRTQPLIFCYFLLSTVKDMHYTSHTLIPLTSKPPSKCGSIITTPLWALHIKSLSAAKSQKSVENVHSYTHTIIASVETSQNCQTSNSLRMSPVRLPTTCCPPEAGGRMPPIFKFSQPHHLTQWRMGVRDSNSHQHWLCFTLTSSGKAEGAWCVASACRTTPNDLLRAGFAEVCGCMVFLMSFSNNLVFYLLFFFIIIITTGGVTQLIET